MYSPLYWDHVRNPRNNRPLTTPHKGEARFARCGDRLTVYLEIREDRIVQASFQARACGPVVAVASIATELLQDTPLDEAKNLDILKLNQQLGGLPPSKRHAFLVFLECLHQALSTQTSKQRN